VKKTELLPEQRFRNQNTEAGFALVGKRESLTAVEEERPVRPATRPDKKTREKINPLVHAPPQPVIKFATLAVEGTQRRVWGESTLPTQREKERDLRKKKGVAINQK